MRTSKSLNIGGNLLMLDLPKVMGIINVTPDSFYSGSRVMMENELVCTAGKMLSEGATFLDVGGYSSRPGAENITVEEEAKRVVQAIRAIKANHPEAIISVDTFRQSVAEAAVNAGADLINDISGGQLDDRMLDFICEARIPYIAMHMRGTPQTMMALTDYDNLLLEVMRYFGDLIDRLAARGHTDLVIDPGFGFAKTVDQNFELLRHLDHLQHLDKPVLAGLSRKSMIYKTLDIGPEDALNGTSVLNALALSKGADILRVHDVKAAMEALKLTSRILN